MDVIQVYQAGVGGVIASLGTAFTADQAKLLKRFTDHVILNFDGDAAGFKAARVSIETFLRHDVKIGVVTLPGNQDPDDFIKEHGVAAYREQLAGAQDFFSFLITYLEGGRDLQADPHARSAVIQELCITLDAIGDPVVREHYLERISSELGVSAQLITQVLEQQSAGKRTPRSRRKKQAAAPAHQNVAFDLVEREFLYLLMHEQDFYSHLDAEQQEALPSILTKLFIDRPWISHFIETGQPFDLMDRLEKVPEQFRELLRAIFFSEEFAQHDDQRIEDLFPDVLRRMLRKLVEVNRQRMRITSPEEDQKRELFIQNAKLKAEYDKL